MVPVGERVGSKCNISQAKAWLCSNGGREGGQLASRLSKVSKTRNGVAHPDVGLLEAIKCAGDSSSDSCCRTDGRSESLENMLTQAEGANPQLRAEIERVGKLLHESLVQLSKLLPDSELNDSPRDVGDCGKNGKRIGAEMIQADADDAVVLVSTSVFSDEATAMATSFSPTIPSAIRRPWQVMVEDIEGNMADAEAMGDGDVDAVASARRNDVLVHGDRAVSLLLPAVAQRSYVDVSLMGLPAYACWQRAHESSNACVPHTFLDLERAWDALSDDVKVDWIPVDPRTTLLVSP